MEIKIEKLTHMYINYVSSIMKERWQVDDEYSLSEIRRYLNNESDSVCYVLIIDDKPIGCGLFDTINEIDRTISPWNLLLWVEPEYRGNGYGLMLTEKRFEYAKLLGYKTIFLDTVFAKEYHLKMGWTVVKEIDNKIIMKYDFI